MPRRSPAVLLVTPLLVALACSSGDEGRGQTAGNSGGVTAVTSITGASVGESGTTLDPTGGASSGGNEGGGSSTGAAASTGGVDSSGGASSSGAVSGDTTTGPVMTTGSDEVGSSTGECAEITEKAMNKKQPADILFVIDNSGSMQVEAASVKTNMNQFSAKIVASGIDVHVVLISELSGDTGMCIDAPLGAGNCPVKDTKLPTFLHIDDGVGSTNALAKLLEHHKTWKDSMRPDAAKHIVIVSDDDSDLGANAFDAAFKALDPSYADYKLHAIVGAKDAGDVLWCIQDPVCDEHEHAGRNDGGAEQDEAGDGVAADQQRERDRGHEAGHEPADAPLTAGQRVMARADPGGDLEVGEAPAQGIGCLLGQVVEEPERQRVTAGELGLRVHAPVADHEVEGRDLRAGERAEGPLEAAAEVGVLAGLAQLEREGRGAVGGVGEAHGLLAAAEAQALAEAQGGAAGLADHAGERTGVAALLAAEDRRDRAGGRGALAGVGGEAAKDHGLEGRRDLGAELAEAGRGAIGAQQRSAGAEGQRAGERLEQHHAEAVQVGARVDERAAELLGGDVGRVLDQERGGGAGREDVDAGEADVGEGDPVIVAEHDAAGREVADDHAAVVDRGQAIGDRGPDRADLVDRRGGAAGDPRREGLARRIEAQAPGRRRGGVARIRRGPDLEQRREAGVPERAEALEVVHVAAADRRIGGELGQQAAEDREPAVIEAHPPALLGADALGAGEQRQRVTGGDRDFVHDRAISSRASTRMRSSPRRSSTPAAASA
jgi:hypothetical protein